MIDDVFLRQVPPALKAGIEDGTLSVHGSVLRHANGQIAGFLQETGGLSKLVGLAMGGPTAPLRLIGDTLKIVQNEQIKHGIMHLQQSVAMLNQLGIASVALGAVGIGVSAVGFAVMSRKIDGLREQVAALGEKLDAIHADVRAIDLTLVADQLQQLRGLARSVDAGWTMSADGARRSWRTDASEARQLHDFFEGRAERLLADRPLAVIEAAPLLDASATASALRVSALALSGETAAAIGVAQDDAARLERLTGGVGAADLARDWLTKPDRLQSPGSDAAGLALTQATSEARAAASTLRNREAVAATRALPLMALEGKGMTARDWLGAARDEAASPLLLMEA